MHPLGLVSVLHKRAGKAVKSPNLFFQQCNRNRKFLMSVLSLYVTSFNMKQFCIDEDSKTQQKRCTHTVAKISFTAVTRWDWPNILPQKTFSPLACPEINITLGKLSGVTLSLTRCAVLTGHLDKQPMEHWWKLTTNWRAWMIALRLRRCLHAAKHGILPSRNSQSLPVYAMPWLSGFILSK